MPRIVKIFVWIIIFFIFFISVQWLTGVAVIYIAADLLFQAGHHGQHIWSVK